MLVAHPQCSLNGCSCCARLRQPCTAMGKAISNTSIIKRSHNQQINIIVYTNHTRTLVWPASTMNRRGGMGLAGQTNSDVYLPQTNGWDSCPSVESQCIIALVSRSFRWPTSLLHLYAYSIYNAGADIAVPRWYSIKRGRSHTFADVDTLAQRVLEKASVLLN